jgi:hypothetical protein
MQDNTTGKRFLFHGHAIAAAGKITSPFQDIIPAQAVSALPIGGGYGSARVEDFRYKEIFSFASAYSEVAGGFVEKDGKAAYETLSLTAIEKVNFMDVVTCDRVVARITASYPADFPKSPASIVTAGSRFERLRVGAHFFEKLDLEPDALDKYDALARPEYVDAGDGAPAQGNEYPPDVLSQPWRISIPQFGLVFLGERFAFQNLRHLLMLRISLGCPVAGDASIGGAVSGGDPYP